MFFIFFPFFYVPLPFLLPNLLFHFSPTQIYIQMHDAAHVNHFSLHLSTHNTLLAILFVVVIVVVPAG